MDLAEHARETLRGMARVAIRLREAGRGEAADEAIRLHDAYARWAESVIGPQTGVHVPLELDSGGAEVVDLEAERRRREGPPSGGEAG